MEIGVIELFGGIGACSQALKRLGFKERIIDYVEIDKFAVKSFNAINDTNYEPQDITKWDKKYYCYNCGNCFKTGKFYEDDDEMYDDVCPNCGCCPVEELTTCVDLIMHGSPCFRAGELVNTIGGMMPIEKIIVGDIVRTASGQWERVSKVFISRSGQLIDIKPACAHLINTTENHPFLVLRNGQRIWVKAKEITTSDYLCVPINAKAERPLWHGVDLHYNWHTEHSNKLPIQDNRFWYLVGRFIGDGWVTRRKERNNNISGIKICCGKSELVELQQEIGDVLPYSVVEDKTTYKLQFCNKELGVFCAEFGIGAKNKHIPQWVLDLDKRYLIGLYHGLVDSDGSYSNGRYKLETISKQLVYNMGELVLKVFGLPYQIYKTERPNTHVIDGRVVKQQDTYSVVWRMGRHNQKINFVKDGYLYSRVRKIASVNGMDTVYNLEVENEHTYCVDNVAVHNCQDFSLAGRQAGGDEGTGTRSSLMYETIRIVGVVKPKIVIWENVKGVLTKKHRHNFEAYQQRMEELGYTNFYKLLNARNYGVPQNRERVFTISIRNDIFDKHYKDGFDFPDEETLGKRLKDILETTVDEKYYLDDAKIKAISNWKCFEKPLEHIMDGDSVCGTITTRSGAECGGMKLVAPFIAASRGRNPDNPSDRTPGCKTERRLEPKYDGITNTITSVQKDNYVVVGDNRKEIRELPSIIQKQGDRGSNNYSVNSETAYTIPANPMSDRGQQVVDNAYRVRKLTPRECWRLMDFSDEAFDKAEKVCSNSQLYKQAGNSIVVACLEKIFKNLLFDEKGNYKLEEVK